MKILTQTLLFVAVIMTSSIIKAGTPSASPSLESTVWLLEHYSDASGKRMQQILPKSSVYASFSDGKLHGSAGCNHYSGQYRTMADNGLTISDRIAATMMACVPAISQQEQQFLSLLPAVTRYVINGKTLQLMNAMNHVILQFVAQTPATLENSDWQARGINNGTGGVVSMTSTHLTTARFEAGTVSGTAGCNDYSASYTVAGDNLTIGAPRATRRMCAQPGIMEQEQQFFQALQQTRIYRLERDLLELRSKEGALQVRFVRHTID